MKYEINIFIEIKKLVYTATIHNGILRINLLLQLVSAMEAVTRQLEHSLLLATDMHIDQYLHVNSL
jgi:hypothetical protein